MYTASRYIITSRILTWLLFEVHALWFSATDIASVDRSKWIEHMELFHNPTFGASQI